MAGRRPFTGPVRAARENAGRSPGVKSLQATALLDDLLRVAPRARRLVLRELSERELGFLLRESDREHGTTFVLWHDTPSGFVEDVLGESVWSLQRQILDATTVYKRVAVPAGFGVGKTHIAARAVTHFVNVRPIGTALAVTTATRFRQVRYQLWPHIRKVVARAGLPGECDTTQYKIPNRDGVDTVVAYGFTAPDNDEAAMQGIHSSCLFLVVDEAGGVSRIIGEGTNNLLTGDARMLAIGNPPSNDPASWFEDLCDEGDDDDHPGTVTIPIPTTASPAITGERTPVCRDCQPNLDGHTITLHMPDQEWVDRTIGGFGEDHPYVIAKVHARFPKGSSDLALPVAWVEAATRKPDPDGDDVVWLDELGLDDEHQHIAVQRGAWIRLGCDVAGSGGDEFTIYRIIGDVLHHRHHASGEAITDQVAVAEKILQEILVAERLAAAIGSTHPVRVKVDQNGIGHGAVGMLQRWAKTGRHHAQIVGVMVSESPEHSAVMSPMRPRLKRDEAWLAMREWLRPDPSTGFGKARLEVDKKCFKQLSLPRLAVHSTGEAVIESKKSMKKRGLDSPDRADGAILAIYEPHPVLQRRRRGLLCQD